MKSITAQTRILSAMFPRMPPSIIPRAAWTLTAFVLCLYMYTAMKAAMKREAAMMKYLRFMPLNIPKHMPVFLTSVREKYLNMSKDQEALCFRKPEMAYFEAWSARRAAADTAKKVPGCLFATFFFLVLAGDAELCVRKNVKP